MRRRWHPTRSIAAALGCCLSAATAIAASDDTATRPEIVFSLPYQPSRTNRVMQCAPTQYWSLYRESDPIEIHTSDNRPIRVLTLRGRLQYSGKPTTLRLPPGHYFIECPEDRAQFFVMPDEWPTLKSIGWSGAPAAVPWALERADRLRLGWVRGGINWQAVQRMGPDKFDWEGRDVEHEWQRPAAPDPWIGAHRGRRSIAAVSTGYPPWIRDPQTKRWKVSRTEFIRSYGKFVEAIAQRYSNDLALFEVWNEPHPSVLPVDGFDDLVKMYAELGKLTRALFPARVRLGGPSVESPSMLYDGKAYRDAGARDFLDCCVYHDYWTVVAAPDVHGWYAGRRWNDARTVPERLRSWREILPRPVVITELGLSGQSALGTPYRDDGTKYPAIDWYRGMCRAIKTAVMYRAGNALLFPHTFLGAAAVEICGFEANDRGPHPKTSAFLMACHWLEGAEFVNSRTIDDKIWLYEFKRADRTRLVFLWCVEEHTVRLLPLPEWRATDVFGTKLALTQVGEEPVLLHAPDRSTWGNTVLDKVLNAIR